MWQVRTIVKGTLSRSLGISNHIIHSCLNDIVKKAYGTGVDLELVRKRETYSGRALGKKMRVRYMPKLPDHTKKLLEIIHSDVCGP